MSQLNIYCDKSYSLKDEYQDPQEISAILSKHGILFERWQATKTIDAQSTEQEILEAYKGDVQRLKDEYGFATADVIRVDQHTENLHLFRQKFLSEHTHSDFEVRYFVEGQGLFYIHSADQVLAILCEAGDLLSLPAEIKHWFDMGISPQLKCIRLFNNELGWVAHYTGDPIADHLPTLDQMFQH